MTYASPVLGTLPVRAITTALVMRVIEPLWTTKSETASRVRGRIEAILDWAKVRGYRDGENTARLKGHFDHLLPDRKKVRTVEHYAALPYGRLCRLHRRAAPARAPHAALYKILDLTAARSGEVRKARWSEIDGATWVIPQLTQNPRRTPRAAGERALEKITSFPQLNDYIFLGITLGKAWGAMP